MVAEPLTMGAYMPVITDADRLIWLVRGMSAGEFTRQFRNGLPAPELLRLIAAPPSDRIDELQERARLAAARAARQALAQGEGLPLAQAIRVAREQAGMDQAELAEVLGVHQSSVSHWEHGRAPTVRQLVDLLRVLPGVADALRAGTTPSADSQPRKQDPSTNTGPA